MYIYVYIKTYYYGTNLSGTFILENLEYIFIAKTGNDYF